jgi:hypothetical protein
MTQITLARRSCSSSYVVLVAGSGRALGIGWQQSFTGQPRSMPIPADL